MRRVTLRSTRLSSSALIGRAPRLISIAFDFRATCTLNRTLRPRLPGLNWLWFIQKNDIIRIQESTNGSSSTAMLRDGGRGTAFRPGSTAAGNAALGAGALYPSARRGSRYQAHEADHA